MITNHKNHFFNNFIGKTQYIANKKAIGRAKDIADIEALGEE